MNKSPQLPEGISIVLPIYLRQPSADRQVALQRCLDSIGSQDFDVDYEVIVIDDGSPCAIDLPRNAASLPIRSIRYSQNRGLVHALNVGISLARYNYIARIDDDDFWLPGKINHQLEKLRSNPNLTIVGTGMTRFDSSGTPIDEHIRPDSWHGLLNFFVEVGSPFPHGSIIARTEIYRYLGGYSHDVRFQHCEDYELWGRWIRFFEPAMIEKSLYAYTVSEHSVSIRHQEQQRNASRFINLRMANLRSWNRIPSLTSQFAHECGLSLVDAGKLLYSIWRWGKSEQLPQSAEDLLPHLLPDREYWLANYREERIKSNEI